MDAATKFKDSFKLFNGGQDMNKLPTKLTDMRALITQLYDVVKLGEVAVDALLSDRSDVLDLKSSVVKLQKDITMVLEPISKNYAAVVKNCTDGGQIVVDGEKRLLNNKQMVVIKQTSEGDNDTGASSTVPTESFFAQAFSGIPVSKLKKTSRGNILVEFPSAEAKRKGTNALEEQFASNPHFSFSEPKKMIPKMTITGVPLDIKNDDIIEKIRRKNELINCLVDEGYVLSFCLSWDKYVDGSADSKNVVLKMDPEIRMAILDAGSYVYMDFSRCKAYDRFHVLRCFHCQNFGHVSGSCPDKNKTPVCSLCAGTHETRNCSNRDTPCCSNCKKSSNPFYSSTFNHRASSNECPMMIVQKNRVIDNTRFMSSKN